MSTILISEIFPPKIGGSGRWLWEIYRRFPKEGLLIAAGLVPGHEEFDRRHTLPLVRGPLGLTTWGVSSIQGIRGYWEALRWLWPLVRQRRISSIHCGKCLPEGLIARLIRMATGIEYICFVHGEEVNIGIAGTESADEGVMASRELRFLTGWVLRGAKQVIANSKNTKRILQESWGIPEERMQLLHPGVDTRRFIPARREQSARATLGWGDRPVILTVGRLQQRKGHDMMIQALHKVRQVVPEVLYAIAGDGERRAALGDLVSAEGLNDHVQFLGRMEDVDLLRCYQQCDLFVLPNRAVGGDIEGFGLVLLEAQSCGKPVVAGDSGGTSETMRIPETGLIVSCDHSETLAAVVTELLSDVDRCARMGEDARRWVVEHFDWDAIGRDAGRILGLTHPEMVDDGEHQVDITSYVGPPFTS